VTRVEQEVVGPQHTVLKACPAPDDHRVAFDGKRPGDTQNDRSQNWLAQPGEDPQFIAVGDPDHGTEFIDWGPTGEEWLLHNHTTGEHVRFHLEDGIVDRFSDHGRPVGILKDGRSVVRMEGALHLYDGDERVQRVKSPDRFGVIREVNVGGDLVAVRVGGGTDDRFSNGLTIMGDTAPAILVYDTTVDTWTTIIEETLSPSIDVMCEPETTSYLPSSTNERAEVRVFRPEETPAPALAIVYSPTDQVYRAWDRWAQYLSHQGYIVVVPSIPATPYSDAAVEDIASVGQWLRERKWVDGDRIAIFGQSSGGRDTAIQLLSRDIWKAGLARNGPWMFQQHWESDGRPEYVTDGIGGLPEDIPEAWARQNPIQQVHELDTPLRIHHAENDQRCPYEYATSFRDALIEAGNTLDEDFEFHTLRAQGHNTADVHQLSAELTLLENFLCRHL